MSKHSIFIQVFPGIKVNKKCNIANGKECWILPIGEGANISIYQLHLYLIL